MNEIMAGTRDLLEKRLKRFLHYGCEQPIYKAGDRFHMKCYSKENVPSLLKLIAEDNPESVIDIIRKVCFREFKKLSNCDLLYICKAILTI